MIWRPVAALALLLVVGAIALATLRPDWANEAAMAARGGPADGLHLADSLRNLVLFLPAGALAALLGLRPAAVLGAGAALSAAIELAQLALPGRDPSVRDVAMNAGGALLGALLVAHARAWLQPTPRRSRGLAAAALAVTLTVAATTAPLLGPAPSPLTYFGHWTPDLGHLAPYDGSLRLARLDGIPVPHGRLAQTPALRAALRGDFRLEVEGYAGRPPDDLAAFVFVSDAAGSEIVLLGPDADDLVLRYRSRGQALGLESLRVRRTGVLAPLRPGSELRAEALRIGADLCLGVNGDRRCGLGPSVADGWMLLLPMRPWLERRRALLGVAWIGLLLAPLGYWVAPRGAGALLWIAAGAALLALPPLAGLLPLPLAGAAAGAAALVAGHALRRLVAAASAGAPREASP